MLIALAPFALRSERYSSAERIGMIGLLLPITTLIFYRNTASYYFVFMLAPVSVACIPSFAIVLRRFPPVVLIALLTSMNIGLFLMENREVIDRQRAVVAFAQAALPRSAYFDHADMLPYFDKQNGFMMPAGMQSYRARGAPLYREAMERDSIPVLLENWWVMSDVLQGSDTSHMLPEDAHALQTNYIEWHFPIWLAGKTVRPAAVSYNEEFLIPGLYEVCDAPVVIDGVTYAVGERLRIGRGDHMLRAAGSDAATLLWANRRDHSLPPPTRGPLWVPL